jgi:Tol biopolymer transport system component/DNA-binding winged helix-turn-helix (wHTH) protein
MNDMSSLALIRALPPQWRGDAPRRIGEFTAHPASNELVGARGVVRVRPRLMDVLLRLAAEPGAVISRTRLLEEVWPRRMVSDEVLSRTIAELRTVLGDDPRRPSYIETIPTVGYRLVAPVDAGDIVAGAPVAPSARTIAATPPAATPPAAIAPRAIAPAATETVKAGGEMAANDADTAAVIEGPLPQAAPWAAAEPIRPAAHPIVKQALHAAGQFLRQPFPVVLAAFAAVVLVLFLRAPQKLPPEAPLAMRLAAATPFTSDPGVEMEPRFSADGQRVVYSQADTLRSRAYLVVQDLSTTGGRRTIGESAKQASYRTPVFIAGSRRLAYARCVDMRCSIVQHDLADASERVLVDADRAPLPYFDVSADGRWLVYASTRRPQFPPNLAIVDLTTGASRDLSLPEAGAGNDILPRFSPDGSRIAFFRGPDGMSELWTIDRDGTHAEAAANARGMVYGAAWRDARHVLVAADWFGYRSLNQVDLVTHEATFTGARGARFPDISPSGEVIYENAQFRVDLWEYDAASGELSAKPMWPSTRFTNNPEYSPDGSRVVFVSNREGEESLFVATRDSVPAKLKLPEGFRYVNAHWSHDGRKLYSMRIGAAPPHAQSAVRIDVATGATERLDALGTEVSDIFPDRDGRYLYYSTAAGPAMQLMRAPLADLNRQEKLPLPLGSSFMIDAMHVAISQPQVRGLTLCTLAGFECEALPLPISDSTVGAWAIGAGGIYYLDVAEPMSLARYDLGERRVSWRSPYYPIPFGRTLAVAPDGAKLLLAREAPTLIDLMIVR